MHALKLPRFPVTRTRSSTDFLLQCLAVLAVAISACAECAHADQVWLSAPMRVDGEIVRSPIAIGVEGAYHRRPMSEMLDVRASSGDPLRTFLNVFLAIRERDTAALSGRYWRGDRVMSGEEIKSNVSKTASALDRFDSLSLRVELQFENEAIFVVDAAQQAKDSPRSFPFSLFRRPSKSEWTVRVGVARSDISGLVSRAAISDFRLARPAMPTPNSIEIDLAASGEGVVGVFELFPIESASSPQRDRIQSAFNAISDQLGEIDSAADLSGFFTERSWRRIERSLNASSSGSIQAAIATAIGTSPRFYMEAPEGHLVVFADQARAPTPTKQLPGLVASVLMPDRPDSQPLVANVLYQDSFLRLVQSSEFRSKVEAKLFPPETEQAIDGVDSVAQEISEASKQ